MIITFSMAFLVVSCFFSPIFCWGKIYEVRTPTELQAALNDAGHNGTFDTIQIFQGHYVGHFNYVEGSSEMDKMTTIKGGYLNDGGYSDDPSITILDAQFVDAVLSCTVQGSIVIENLTIKNGSRLVGGAGVNIGLVVEESDITPGTALIMNNHFLNNRSETRGGAIAIDAVNTSGEAGRIWILRNLINGNQAGTMGGGAHLFINAGSVTDETGQIVVLENTITRNISLKYGGGGLYIESRSPSGPAGKITVKGNIIKENRAGVNFLPGVGGGFGGGVSILSKSLAENQQDSYPEQLNMIILEENTIMNNVIVNGFNGGGAYVFAESTTADAASITVRKNIVSENSSPGLGGGMEITSRSYSANSGNIVVEGNLISSNHSERAGGLSVASSDYPTGKPGHTLLTNNFIVKNKSTTNYGGLLTSDFVTLVNNTVAHNEAMNNGGGVGLASGGNPIGLFNNIIWGNTALLGGDIVLIGASTFSGFNNDYGDMAGSWLVSEGNINQDPIFIGNGDYHLKISSPCKNAGTIRPTPWLPPTDYDGQKRIMGSAPDIGADELLELSIMHFMPAILAIPHKKVPKN